MIARVFRTREQAYRFGVAVRARGAKASPPLRLKAGVWEVEADIPDSVAASVILYLETPHVAADCYTGRRGKRQAAQEREEATR